ncbi:MAG: 1-acyl-sn-glycerol-3-phosphate acyltransferase [Rhodospirillales bacterium]|nr:1-acyl-sn-glycerol-3-phosphate acyltransferase [Rhodospirillales bacterium]
MGKHWRAATRLFRALGIIAGATWNIAVKKPEGETLEHVQQKLYNDLKDLLGIKVVFNEAAAPLERKRPTWYLANHTSYGDFIVLGAALRGTFAGKGEILTWPLVRHIAKAAKYIGLRRSANSIRNPVPRLSRTLTQAAIRSCSPKQPFPPTSRSGTLSPGTRFICFTQGFCRLSSVKPGKTKKVMSLNFARMSQTISVRRPWLSRSSK